MYWDTVERMEAETQGVKFVLFPRPEASNYYNSAGVSREVDASNIICIGGTGIDGPICLNYHRPGADPRVVYLEMPNEALEYWRVIAPTFRALLQMPKQPFGLNCSCGLKHRVYSPHAVKPGRCPKCGKPWSAETMNDFQRWWSDEAGRRLEFEGPTFTDTELNALPNLDKVEGLALRDTAVTDKGCHELLRARALVEVSILSDTLSDEVLQVLAQLPALRSLLIHRGPRIGDGGVRHLSRCAELQELYLKETAVTDQGLMAIHDLPQVWSLVLDGTLVSDKGCAALAEMPQLSLLSLNRTRVAGYGLAALRNNEHFNVYLEGTPASDKGVIAIAQRMSNLQLISLNQTSVGDSAARALAKLPRLNDVRLSYTKLTDAGLGAFSGHPHLEVIYAEGCAITESAVNALRKSSRHELTVYGP